MVWNDCYILYMLFVHYLLQFLAPYGEAEIFPEPFAPWSPEFIFGTDQIGRDILSRMIYGARNTVSIAVATTALAFLIGGTLGLAAAINMELVRSIFKSISRCFDGNS